MRFPNRYAYQRGRSCFFSDSGVAVMILARQPVFGLHFLIIFMLMLFWSPGNLLGQSLNITGQVRSESVAEASSVDPFSPTILQARKSELDRQNGEAYVRAAPSLVLLPDDLRGKPFSFDFHIYTGNPGSSEWKVIIDQEDKHGAILAISEDTLTVNTSNWDQPQTVTVSHTGNPTIMIRRIWFTLKLEENGKPLHWAAFGIIVDDSEKPKVSLEAHPNPVNEGQCIKFTVTIDEAQDRPVTVPIFISMSQEAEWNDIIFNGGGGWGGEVRA